jgi:hypothetical protein
MNRILFAGLIWLLLTASHASAESVLWSDNFETNAASRWLITNGVWHFGSPTKGPALNAAGFRTHSGTNCASTQNYPYNKDARLICTNYNGTNFLLIPSADQFPRLRFWHWFNFANALGYVEIKSGSNDWQQISPTYENINSGGIWSRPYIDLSSFAGQNIQLAFHFTSGGCCGNALGWFVDDVAVVTGQPVFDGSFETAATNDWSVDFGTWQIGKPTSGPNAAHTGVNCAGTILAGNYPNNVDSRLISPPFNISSTNSSVSFWQWYNFNNALGVVEISTDGSDWNQLSPIYLNGNTGGVWNKIVLDLSAYIGQTNAQIGFHFKSGGVKTAAGWYVDDVTFIAAPVLTVPMTQTIYAGQTFSVTLSATNSLLTNSIFTFALAAPSSDVSLTTNGILTWTNTTPLPGTNFIYVQATDNSVPPLQVTNDFEVIVLPSLPSLTVSNNFSSSHNFQFSFNTVSNATWHIDVSSNLINWFPVFTNTADSNGVFQFTDFASTNFPFRFYRAISP